MFLKLDLLTTITANLLSFLASGSFSWTSPIIPKLLSNDSTINPLSEPSTVLQNSILSAIPFVGAFAGTLASGLIVKRFAKKKTLLVCAIPMLIAHLMFAFARNIEVFIIGRVIFGSGFGLMFSVLPGYTSEIASDKNRGFLGTFISILGCLGQVFVYAIGPYVSIKTFSLIHLVPFCLFFVVFHLFCPESPFDLAAKADLEGAERVLKNLRFPSSVELIKSELFVIKKSIQAYNEGCFKDLFTNKTLRKAVTITSAIVFLMQASGLAIVLAYMQTIFDFANTGLSSSVSPIIVQAVFFISVLFTSQLIDRMGRKFFLLLSSVGIIVSLGPLGFYFLFKFWNFDVSQVSWLPLLCLIGFVVFYSLGFMNVPWILIGECFPPSHKSEASIVTMISLFSMSILVTLCYPLLNDAVGLFVIWWIFCGILAVGIVFIVYFVPETKGRTLLEIQNLLGGNKS